MYLFLSILSFFVITLLLNKLSTPLKLIDYPDSRKLHKGKIPLIGGLIIYLNVIFFSFNYELSYYFSIILYTSSILLILGSLDDAIGLGVNFRLIAQLSSCLIITGSGLVIENIGDYMFLPKIDIGLLSIAFTVFCVIGLTNSFNFIDGIDGLCGTQILVSIFSILIFSYFLGTYNSIYDKEIISIIIISIICFLFLNLSNSYKIFLGDAGSITLGFFVSWLLILSTQFENAIIHPVLALWCVSLPVLDIISVVIRRIVRKINPFKPDRRHIHHLLIETGLNPKIVLSLILLISIIINSFGFLIFYFFGPMPALLNFFILIIVYLFSIVLINRKILNQNF